MKNILALSRLILVQALLIASARAQDFQISALDIESLGALQAVSISHNGRFLIFRETISENNFECDWLFDRLNNSKLPLCQRGLAYAIKVNDKGTVLGGTSTDSQSDFAAVWRLVDELAIIHDPQDITTPTSPVDLDDHDRTYAVANRSVAYTAGNANFTSSYDSPRALIWSKARGTRLLFPNDKRANIVLAASNSGKLIVQRSSQDDPSVDQLQNEPYYQHTMESFLKLPNQRLKHVPHSNLRSYYSDYFLSDLVATSSINDRSDDIIIDGMRFIKARRRQEVAKRYQSERSDTPYTMSLSSNGNVVGLRGFHAFIESATAGAIDLNCLIAQNRVIAGSTNLTARTMADFAVGGVSNGGTIFMSADLESDGRYGRLFFVDRQGDKSTSISHSVDYCPGVTIDELPNIGSDQLRYKVTLKSGGRIYPGIHLKIVANDVDGDGGEVMDCPALVLGPVTTGTNGSAIVRFKPDSHFTYEVQLASPDDSRYFISSIYYNVTGVVLYYGDSFDQQCTTLQN